MLGGQIRCTGDTFVIEKAALQKTHMASHVVNMYEVADLVFT